MKYKRYIKIGYLNLQQYAFGHSYLHLSGSINETLKEAEKYKRGKLRIIADVTIDYKSLGKRQRKYLRKYLEKSEILKKEKNYET